MAKKKSSTEIKKNTKVYKINYDKRAGGVGSVLVKSDSPKQALKNAKNLVFTGRNFRNPRLVDKKEYSKPRKQGFQGSGRM